VLAVCKAPGLVSELELVLVLELECNEPALESVLASVSGLALELQSVGVGDGKGDGDDGDDDGDGDGNCEGDCDGNGEAVGDSKATGSG
jgi:hypothetical protein